MAMPKTKMVSYAKNLGKSISYSAIDAIKESNPAIAGFIDTNKDIVKGAYNAIAHVDKVYTDLTTQLMESKYGDMGRNALKNVKDDLKSGKWYNLERKRKSDDTAMEAAGWGNDDEDFGFEAMASGDLDFFSDGDDSLESMVDLVGQKSSQAVSEAIIQTTEQSINAQANIAKATAQHNEALYANIHAGMGTINENIGKLIEIANGPITTHMENSKTFFESETKLSEERNNILKEMLDIQKSIYRKEQKAAKSKITMYSIMDENGMPDLELYFERVLKNINDNSGGMGDMVKDMLEGGVLESMIASPLQAITDVVAKQLIPKALKGSMEQFNKSVSGLFGSAMSKLMNSESENPILNFIKNTFGISDVTKSSIRTDKYEKGAVPFDGITRKSIVEVIPTYLARIESAMMSLSGISGKEIMKLERRFNFESGKFVNANDIRKNFRYITASEKKRANNDITKYFDNFMNMIDFGDDKKRKKQIRKNFDRIMNQSFSTGVLFNPKEIDKYAVSDYNLTGETADDDLEFIRKVFETIPKDVMLAYANNVYSAKNSITKQLERLEDSGHDISQALFNDSLAGVRGKGRPKKKKKKGSTPPRTNTRAIGNNNATRQSRARSNTSNDNDSDGHHIFAGGEIVTNSGIILPSSASRSSTSSRQSSSNKNNKKNITRKKAEKLINKGTLSVKVKNTQVSLEEFLDDTKNKSPEYTLGEYLENKEKKKQNKPSSVSEGIRRLTGQETDDKDEKIEKAIWDKDDSLSTAMDVIDKLQEMEEKEKNKNKKKKSKIREKLDEAAKSSSGINKLISNVEKLINKPTDFLAGIIKKADNAIYELIFGVEYDEDGERKSVAKAIFDGLKEQFEEFKVWMKKAFKPVRDWFNKEGTLGNKAKKFVKEQLGNLGESEFGQQFKDFFHITEKTVKDAASSIADTIKEDLAEDKDKLDRVDSLKSKLKEKDKPLEGTGETEELKDNGQAAAGMRRVKKTGVIAVSEGEMVIPPDLNPYNIKKREANENREKRKFAKSLADRIHGYDSGGIVGADGNPMDIVVGNGKVATKSGIVLSSRMALNATSDKNKTNANSNKIEANDKPKDIDGAKKSSKERLAELYLGSFRRNFDKTFERFESYDEKYQNKIINALKSTSKAKDIIDVLNHEQRRNLFSKHKEEIKGAFSNAWKRGKELAKGENEEDNEGKTTSDYISDIINKALNTNGEMTKEQKKLVDDGVKDIKNHIPEAAAGGVIGAGISFLTGAVGGPLVGAAVGTGISLIKNSESVNKMLFGDKLTDEHGNVIGRRGNGILSEELTKNIHKYAPGVGKGAILGGISALLPITPFGPFTGILLGSAIGFAANNEKVRESLFGDEGFFGKDTDKKIKKALPSIGLGAAAGLIMGPFGAIPNIMLGSAAGFATTTDKFKDMLFGKEDEDGKRHGGIIETAVHGIFKPIGDFTKDTVTDLVSWAEKNIKRPLKDAVQPIKKQFQLMFQSIHKGINSLFQDALGATFDDLLKDYIFKPVTGFIKKTTGMMLKPLKMIVSSPFKLIGAVGNKLRDRQVKRGQADYMTADERIAWREQRGLLKSGSIMPWNFGRTQRFKKYDDALSNIGGADAKSLSKQLEFALNSEKALENSTNEAYEKFTKTVRKNKKLNAKQVNDIADKIKKYVKKEKGSPQKAAKGAHAIIDKINGLDDKDKAELKRGVDEYIGSIQGMYERKAKFGDNMDAFKQVLMDTDEFKEAGITEIDNKDLPKLLDYLKAEAKAKTAIGEEESGTENAVENADKAQGERHKETIDVLREINENLKKLAIPNIDRDGYNADALENENGFTAPTGRQIRQAIGRGTGKAVKGTFKYGTAPLRGGVKAVKAARNSNIGNKLFGNRDVYFRDVNNLDEEDIPQSAAGGLFEDSTLAAVSKGEVIVSPNSIKNYAAGGIPGSGDQGEIDSINVTLDDISGNASDKLIKITKGGEVSDTLLARLAQSAANLTSSIPALGDAMQYLADDITDSTLNKEMSEQGGTLRWLRNKVGKNRDDEEILAGAAAGKEITKSGLIAVSKGEYIVSPEIDEEIENTLQNSIKNFAKGGTPMPGEGEVDENETSEVHASLFDRLKETAVNKINKVKYEFSNGKLFKFITDNEGEYILDKSDSETMDSMNKLKEEENEKKNLFKSITDMPKNFVGKMKEMFLGKEDSEDKKNKKGILGKLFSVFGGGKDSSKGLLGTAISAVIGVPILTGILRNFLGNTEIGKTIKNGLDGLVQNLNLGENLGDLGNKIVGGIVGWLRGEDGALGGGLPGLLQAGIEHWATGFEFICTEIAPKAIEILVGALPSLLMGVGKGIASIIGINFHNAIHGGEGSKNLVQSDKNISKDENVTIARILSKNGGHKFNWNGNAKGRASNQDWKSLLKIDTSTNGVINTNFSSMTNGMSVADVITKATDENSINAANTKYDAGIKDGSIKDYKNTQSYKDLSEGMREKLDKQLAELEKDGKNVVQVNTGTSENPKYEYKTLQEVLAMDNITLGRGLDENGNPMNLTGEDILNNPSLGEELGLNWQLTDEERQKIKESKGLAKNTSLGASATKAAGKAFLRGRGKHTIFRTAARGAALIPFVGKFGLAPALYGADALVYNSGKLGARVMPDWLTGGAKTAAKEAAQNPKTIKGKIKKKVKDKIKGKASGLKDKILKKGAKDVAGDVVEEVAESGSRKALDNTLKKTGKSGISKTIDTIIETVTKNIKKIFNNNTVLGKIGEGLKKAGKKFTKEAVQEIVDKIIKKIEQKALPKFVEALAKSSVKVVGKIAAQIASGGIITAAFAAGAFINGFNHAETVLGVIEDNSVVDYDPAFTTKLVTGLVSLLNEVFFMGLIPLDLVFDIIYEPVKLIFNIDPEKTKALDEARAKSEDYLKQYNLEHDTNMTIDEYNVKDKWYTKAKNGAKNIIFGKKDKDTGERKGGIVGTAKDAWNWVTGKSSGEETSAGAKAAAGAASVLLGGPIGAVVTGTRFAKDFFDKRKSKKEEEKLQKYNQEHGTNLSMEEYNQMTLNDYNKKNGTNLSMEEFKNKDKLSTKIGNVFLGKKNYETGEREGGIAGAAKSAVNGIANAGKSIAGKAWDIGKNIGNVAGMAMDYATYKSDKKASEQIEASTDPKNPLSTFGKFFAGSMDTVFAPVRGIFTIGKGIQKIVSNVMDFASKFTKQVQNDARRGKEDFEKGDLKSYFTLTHTEVDAEGNEVHNPLSPFRTFIKASTRILNFPALGLMWVGKQIGKSISNIINAAKSTIEVMTSAVGKTIEVANTGSIGDYFDFSNGTEPTQFEWLNTAVTGATRIVMMPVAAGIAVGNKIKEGVSNLINGAKTVFDVIHQNADKTMEIAKEGSISKYFDFNNEKSDKLPLDWLGTAFTAITRIVMIPAAAGVAIGTKIKEGIGSIIEGFKSFATDNVKDQAYVLKYYDKDNLDKYWDSPVKKEGFTGVILSVMGTINRVTQFIPITLSQVVGKIGDALSKPINWVKEKVGGFADGVAEFFGVGGTDKEGKNSKGQTAALGEGGSGSGVLSKIHARGSKPSSDPKYKDDPSFVSQVDSRYANTSFNVAGDSKKQTIADTGCGPAAAAMVVNNATNSETLNMKTAAKDALRYKVKDGGVNAAYFENEFSKHGLSTNYILDSDRSNRNQDILNNLYSGNRTVLMGNDASNRSKSISPYGPNDHYIVATRASRDGKYIWINDPESKTPEVKYPASVILNNTKMGIAGVAASGSKILNKIHASGSHMSKVLQKIHASGKYGPDTVEYKVWNGLRAAGWDEIHVAAIMGNLYQESEFKPEAIEKSNGVGFGLVQWSRSRRTAIENFAQSIGKPPTDLVGVQIPFLIGEMTPGGGCNGFATYQFMNQTKAGKLWKEDDFKNATDLATATAAFCWTFERPSEVHAHLEDRRLPAAQGYYEAFTGQPIDASISGGAISGSTDSNSSNTGGTVLDKIFGALSGFAKAFGLTSSDSSSSSTGGSIAGAVSDKQQALVEKMKSIEGQLDYSQSARNPDNGSGDCSSTVQWAYKNVLGPEGDPGDWSGAYETSPNTYTVTNQLDPNVMQPGDAIVYNGHVEMYAGNGQMIGHGGPGKGPTTKPLSDKKGRFKMVRRWNGFKDLPVLDATNAGTSTTDGTSNEETNPQYDDKGNKLNVSASGTGLKPDKDIYMSDTVVTSDDRYSDKNGFLRKSRYNNSLNKNVKVPASMYAAGSNIDDIIDRVPTSSMTRVRKTKNTNSNKLDDYLKSILKLLAKEVENTSMLTTIITILKELIKIYEEERKLTGSNDKEIQQKRDALNSKRESMLTILNATGIQGNGQSNDLTKLIKDAQRLASI